MTTRSNDISSRFARGFAFVAIVCVLLGLAFTGEAAAQPAGIPPEMQHAGVNEHLDSPLPLDTKFRDHTGKTVALRDVIDGKRPVVLTFAYHTCPQLCSMVLNALVSGLKDTPWTIGDQFDVVTISIDPNESIEKTSAKRASMLAEYRRPVQGAAEGRGWHFLVGDAPSIAAVASAAGFESQYDAEQKQWAHPSVVMVVTPDGKMARYLYGIEFPANDLRLALLEASKGRSISTVEQIILYCYHYDPKGGKYVLVAQRVMQIGAAAVALVLIGTLAVLWSRELRKKPTQASATSGDPARVSAA